MQTIPRTITKFTTEEFISKIESRINATSPEEWKNYVSFARITLIEIREILDRAKTLYREYGPNELENVLGKLLEVISAANAECENRTYVTRLLNKVKTYLVKPSLRNPEAYW